MNRATRRKLVTQALNRQIKTREIALKKKQYGIGLILTNLMFSIIFWRWTWVIIDRRAKP